MLKGLVSFGGAFLLCALLASPAFAEPRRDHLSIGLGAIELGDLSPAAETLPAKLELRPLAVPDFLRREVRHPREGVEGLLGPESLPEWRRLRILMRERESLRLVGFSPAPANLVTVDEATRQLQALDPIGLTGVLPVLDSVRVISSVISAQANELLARGMSVEVGDRVDSRYTPLRGLAGDIQRGQYLRTDDVTGRQFNFDVRLILAWRPSSNVRIEAGYAVAYLSGESQTNFGQSGPTSDRTSSYLVHGPCAAVNLDF